jgi:hypothetical protein
LSEIRVTYSGLIALLTAFAGVGFGLIFMVVVTRTLSIEEYGTWGLIIGLLAYGSIFKHKVLVTTTMKINPKPTPANAVRSAISPE